MGKDLEMMNNPDHWPKWPYLPLTKQSGDLGVLVESGDQPVVILGNLFMLPKTLDQSNTIKYASAAAVIADGWEVD